MAEVDLGAYIPRESNDPAAEGGTWGELVKVIRANRPFFAGAGAQLLMGSPGGIGANLGAAIAKGNESQNMTEEMNYNRGVEERKFQAGQEEGEKNRKSHERIAELGADSRLAVAQERVSGMLERSRMIHGPQGPKEMDLFFKAKNAYMHDEANRELLSKLTRQQQEEYASAYAKTTLQQAREATGVRSQGAALPSGLGGPDATASALGVGTPPAQTGAPPATPKAAATSNQRAPTWDEYIQKPGVKESLQDPAFVEELVKKRPDFGKYLYYGSGTPMSTPGQYFPGAASDPGIQALKEKLKPRGSEKDIPYIPSGM